MSGRASILLSALPTHIGFCRKSCFCQVFVCKDKKLYKKFLYEKVFICCGAVQETQQRLATEVPAMHQRDDVARLSFIIGITVNQLTGCSGVI